VRLFFSDGSHGRRRCRRRPAIGYHNSLRVPESRGWPRRAGSASESASGPIRVWNPAASLSDSDHMDIIGQNCTYVSEHGTDMYIHVYNLETCTVTTSSPGDARAAGVTCYVHCGMYRDYRDIVHLYMVCNLNMYIHVHWHEFLYLYVCCIYTCIDSDVNTCLDNLNLVRYRHICALAAST
jgi:hypothetical protein